MPDGTFQVSLSTDFDTSTIAGAFSVAPSGEVVATGNDQTQVETPSCGYRVDFIAVRFSTTTDRIAASRSAGPSNFTGAREPMSAALSWTSGRLRQAP